MNNEKGLDEESRRGLYLDIYNDAVWLIDLVENLLYATRIEEGRMKLRTSAELLSDIIDEAVRHIGRKAQGRRLTVEYEDELLLVKADGRLVEAGGCEPGGQRVKIYGSGIGRQHFCAKSGRDGRGSDCRSRAGDPG